jgi:hypothetical protein
MKEIYVAPEATVVTMAAIENLAVIEDRGAGTRAGDILDATTSIGSGRPK